jgi:hypothetical protein
MEYVPMANDTPADKAASKAAADKAAADQAASTGNAPRTDATQSSAVQPESFKSNDQAPEPNRDPVPTFRADMGEGLPPQKDQLNPDRAK